MDERRYELQGKMRETHDTARSALPACWWRTSSDASPVGILSAVSDPCHDSFMGGVTAEQVASVPAANIHVPRRPRSRQRRAARVGSLSRKASTDRAVRIPGRDQVVLPTTEDRIVLRSSGIPILPAALARECQWWV